MSKTKTRQEEDTKNDETMSVSLELGEKHWKVAVGSELGGEMKLKQIRAGNGERLVALLKNFRDELGLSDQARIVSCYEAGREGFWLHRFLQTHGVQNLIVDSASIEISRRARRAKTDRLDAEKLLTMLQGVGA